ncbi:hypothetical protein AB0F32_24490 [Streptomyces albidoflavus]|uniref:hypothetical protein n=1 Tax=Streptomyces albidoflavus TaxID=1886 RepID=UPI0034043CBB|nr:hypothetical protein OH723_24280 [Streptomyces albidoflavus]
MNDLWRSLAWLGTQALTVMALSRVLHAEIPAVPVFDVFAAGLLVSAIAILRERP